MVNHIRITLSSSSFASHCISVKMFGRNFDIESFLTAGMNNFFQGVSRDIRFGKDDLDSISNEMIYDLLNICGAQLPFWRKSFRSIKTLVPLRKFDFICRSEISAGKVIKGIMTRH